MFQVFKNSFFTILDLVIYPLLMVLLTPFLIASLGNVLFGIWMSAGIVVQYIYVLNFGFAESTIKATSNAEPTSSDFEALKQLFTISNIFALAAITLGGLLVYCNVFVKWFSISVEQQEEANLIIFIYLSSTALKLPELVILSGFKGLQRFDIASAFSVLSKNLPLLVIILGIGCKFSLSLSMLISFFVFLVIVIVEFFCFNWYSKQFKLKVNFKNFSIVKNQLWFWLQNILGLFGFLADKMLVGYVANVVIAGYYAIASMIASQLYNGFNAFGSFVFPKAQKQQQNFKELLRLYYKSRLYLSLFSIICIVILILLKEYLFLYWLKAEVYNNTIEFIVYYLVYILLFSHNIIPNYFISASTKPWFNSYNELVYRSFQIAAILVGYFIFQLDGILIALCFCASVYIAYQYYVLESKIFKIKSLQPFLVLLLGLLCFLLIACDLNLVLKGATTISICLLYYLVFIKPVSYNNYES